MLSWSQISAFESEPKLSDLDLPYTLVVRDVARFGVYEDIVHVAGTLFAAVNQRHSVSGAGNDFVTRFYWADSSDALLRAAFGYIERQPGSSSNPPEELLLTSRCRTYGEILQTSTANQMPVTKRTIPARGSVSLVSSVCLSIARKEYYFICEPEETVDIKDWSNAAIAAIGFRTFRSGRIEGTT